MNQEQLNELSEFDRLDWQDEGTSRVSKCQTATIGTDDDGVTFRFQHVPTCYRRGPWRLHVEVHGGPGHHKWGCFDDQDQPTRHYHLKESLLTEADAIARVLITDRCEQGPIPFDLRAFHKSRIMFIVVSGHLLTAERDDRSHEEWCNSMEIRYDIWPRGYANEDGIFWYQGKDMGQVGTIIAFSNSILLANKFRFCMGSDTDREIPIYNGIVQQNEPGIWPPQEKIGTMKYSVEKDKTVIEDEEGGMFWK